MRRGRGGQRFQFRVRGNATQQRASFLAEESLHRILHLAAELLSPRLAVPDKLVLVGYVQAGDLGGPVFALNLVALALHVRQARHLDDATDLGGSEGDLHELRDPGNLAGVVLLEILELEKKHCVCACVCVLR